MDIDGPRGLEYILIYPHYWQCEFDKLNEYTIPSVSFKDLLLVERVYPYTQAPYYCWEKAITDDLSFSVCKEYFEEEFVKGQHSTYVGMLLHGGLYREAEARTQELSLLRGFQTSRYGLEPGQSK